MKNLIGGLILLFGWLAAPSAVQAWQTEDWRVVGDTNQAWNVEGERVTGLATEQNQVSWLVLREDLFPPPANFKFQLEFTPLQGADHNLVWNFIDEHNYYQAHFNGGAVWVSRLIAGQEMLSVAKNFTIERGQIYAIDLKQESERIMIAVDNQTVIDFTDWTHNEQSHGSVGFKLAPGAIIPVESRFDRVVINDPALTILPVELIKQTAPAWTDLIYDTADQWSTNPTVGRWGCALTSLTMVMRSYGLVTMPAGDAVTPAAINSWLLTQPDGYIGQGLLNWWAGTRLISQISERYSTATEPLPKLEFSYLANAWPARPAGGQSRLTSELTNHRPAIVQVPGHFVVAHGFDQNTQDYFIRDPFYDFTRLSQHQSPISLRLFTPSQTDLSAIVIVHRPSLTVAINNQFGENIAQTWSEWLDSDPSDEQTATWQFTVINQPADGEYKLLFEGANLANLTNLTNSADLQILTYNQDAELHILTPPPTEVLNSTLLTLPISFTKLNGAVPINQFDWSAFLVALENLAQAQHIDQPTFTRLQTLAQIAQHSHQATWPRYKTYLKNILELAKNPQIEEKISALQATL